jgi:hypothetical protein
MTPTITTFRPWHPRSLADIGVDASEIDSIDAESRDPRAGITRRRIVLA